MRTIGVDWKVPIQAVITVIVWVLLHYTGIDLSLQVEGIAAVAVGALSGAAGPAPRTVPDHTPGP